MIFLYIGRDTPARCHHSLHVLLKVVHSSEQEPQTKGGTGAISCLVGRGLLPLLGLLLRCAAGFLVGRGRLLVLLLCL